MATAPVLVYGPQPKTFQATGLEGIDCHLDVVIAFHASRGSPGSAHIWKAPDRPVLHSIDGRIC